MHSPDDDSTLIKVDPADIPTDGHFIVSGTVGNIADYAFDGCTRLTQVTFLEGLVGIGHAVFCGCTGLTQLTFPESLIRIERFTFEGCTGLTEVTFPENLTAIDEGLFINCTGLTKITFPEGLVSIGEDVFLNCTALRFIVINTQSEDACNLIRALLPEDLQGKVIIRADYEALSLQAEELRKKALTRLCGAPQMHPLAKARSFFPATEASGISVLGVPGVIRNLNEWVGSNNPVYDRAKQEMDALLLPRNESEFPAYQVQLDDILTSYGVLDAAAAASVEVHAADGGAGSLSP